MVRRGIIAFASSIIVAGCASTGSTVNYQIDGQLVAVSEITGAVKCALALALEAERDSGYPRLAGNMAVIKYKFQVVDTTKQEVSVGARAVEPFVFAFGAGTGSVLPDFLARVEETNTVITTINSRVGLAYESTRICRSVPERVRSGLSFERWLAGVISQLDVHAGASPYGIVDNVEFEAKFGVARTGGTGAGFEFVMLGGKVDATATRNDVQELKITIQAPTATASYPEVIVNGLRKGRPVRARPGPPVRPGPLPTPSPGTPRCQSNQGIGCLGVPPSMSVR